MPLWVSLKRKVRSKNTKPKKKTGKLLLSGSLKRELPWETVYGDALGDVPLIRLSIVHRGVPLTQA